MTNIVAPNGFKPVGHLLGLDWTDKQDIFVIKAADTNPIWVGQPVVSIADGDAQGIPAVTVIAAGGEAAGIVKGVIVGIYAVTPGNLNFQGVPLTTEVIPIPAVKTRDWYVMVNTDPYTIYEIQDDGLAALDATSCNKNASYSVVDGVSTILADSATVLDTSSVATTSTLPLRILGLSKNTSTNAFGVYARWRVRFNTHEAFGSTAGV